MANRVGEQLGNYHLVGLLGQGSSAEVYLGEHLYLKTQAAVKVLRTHLDDDDVKGFLNEARTIAQLVHPNIVRTFDFDVKEGVPFLVMDHAVNGTLRQRYPRYVPLPLYSLLHYTKQVADALQYAHDQNLIHRDIKPENMLLGRHNEVLLSDFGIVQVAQSSLQQSNQVAGTVAYMSPEQFQGKARFASDQYALGIIIYEWLTGDRPFHGSFTELTSQHLFVSPAPLHEKIPTIPPAIEDVVLTALAKDPKQRFPSVRDFANALEQAYLSTLSLPSAPIHTPYAPTPSKSPGSSNVTSQQERVPHQLPVTPIPPAPFEIPIVTTPSVQVSQTSFTAAPAIDSDLQPIGISLERPLQQQRKNKVGRIVLLSGLVILIIAATSTAYFVLLNKPSSPELAACKGVSVCKASDGEYIGISDGTFAFDTNRPDGALKRQAADKLKVHNNNGVKLLQQAVEQDTNDAEALIYLEDQRVLASGRPYITFVVGTMPTGTFVSDGRYDLQGAYLAQKEFNDHLKLPGGVQVRLLIANSGDEEVYVTTVAKQIVQAAQVDKTIVGVMGWPFSGASRDAISVLSAAHIPMISPTASFDFLTGASSYFFRVIPSNKRQVFVSVQYAEHMLHVTRAALFVDPADAYSKEWALDFEQQFVADGNNLVATENYTVGHKEMLPGLLQDALNHNPDVIYFAGYATDAGALLTELPTSGPFAHLQIIGANGLDGSYPSNVSAKLNRLHFTTFIINRDTWNFLGLSTKKPAFFVEYAQAFDPQQQHTSNPYGYTLADVRALYSYDAMLALLTGSRIALAGREKIFSPDDLQRALTKITGSQALQGVSGQISFGPDGDVVNKATVLLGGNPNGSIKIESVQGTLLVGL